jgi:hypothetical protein
MQHQKEPTGAGLVLLAGVAAPLLLWARAPDAFAHPQFFAEDLALFWPQWRDLGLSTFWTPYGGYLHLAPRIGTAFASLAPYPYHPVAFLAVAVAVAVWTAMTVASAELPRGLGPACAILILLVPHDGEVWASLVNMQWIMACVLPIIAMTTKPRSTAARANQLTFLTVAALTGPFSAFVIPLWVARGWRALKARERYGLLVATIGTLAGFTQLIMIASSQSAPETPTQPRPFEMAVAFIERFGLDHLSAFGSGFGIFLLLCLLLSPVLRQERALRASLLTFAIMLMIPTFLKFYRMPELIIARAVAGRYFYVPSVMLLWTAASLLWIRKPLTVAIGGLSGFFMLLAASQHFVRQPRSFYPDWQQKSGQIDKETVSMQFAPGWSVTIAPRSR